MVLLFYKIEIYLVQKKLPLSDSNQLTKNYANLYNLIIIDTTLGM